MVRTKRARLEGSPPQEDDASGSSPDRPTTDQEKREIIQNWKVANERGFNLSRHVNFRKYHTLIERLGWTQFVALPIKPCLALVHEFYANLHKSNKPDEVKVFGRDVKYSAKVINRLFGIPPLEEQDALIQYHELDNRPSIEEMSHTLTLGRPGDLVPRTRAYKIGSLCEEARWWRKFMTGRILGSIKEGETTIEQQIVLFCILLGKRFDVGRLINMKINAIRAKIRDDSMGKLALSFPSIITMLCRNVPRPQGSFEIECMQPVTDRQLPNSRLEPSVLEFHLSHWGNRGTPSWVPPVPTIEYPIEHPTSPPSDEDRTGHEAGSSSSNAQFDPQAWQEFQNV